MKLLKTLLIFLLSISVYCQENSSDSIHFKQIDSLAKIVKYNGDIRLLSYDLTKNLTKDIDKARAIFIWITDNIEYNYKVLNKKKRKPDSFKCSGDNCDIKHAEWEDHYLKRVINKKRGVCSGYARLFKKLCDHAGIQGSVVNGYTKDSPGEIGKMGTLNHAWNVMLIDGKYHYLDATWAAGGCYKNRKGKYYGFKKKLDEYYWLTPIEKLSRDHFPADSSFIRHATYKKAKKTFKENAFIRTHEIPNLELITPNTGIITVSKSDTIHFKFSYKAYFNYLQINTNLSKNKDPWIWDKKHKYLNPEIVKDQKSIPHHLNDDIVSFTYLADNKKLKYIDILIDFDLVIRVKVNVLP